MSFLSWKQRGGRAPIQNIQGLARSRLFTTEMQMFFITSHAGHPAACFLGILDPLSLRCSHSLPIALVGPY